MKHFVKTLIFLTIFSTIQSVAISRKSGVKDPSEIEPADTTRYMDKGNIWEYNLAEEIDLGGNVYKVWLEENSGQPRLVKYHVKYDKEEVKAEKVDKPDLAFYKSSNTRASEMAVARVFPSPNLEYVGVTQYLKVPTKRELGKMKFVLLDKNGSEIWGKEYDIGYEWGGRTYYVSDKGDVGEFDNSHGTLTFYERGGSRVKRVQFFKEGAWEPARGIRGKFSGNGDYFVAGVNDPDKEIFSSGTGVILFASVGEELWRFETEGNHTNGIYISNAGNYIIVSSSTWGKGNVSSYAPIDNFAYLLDRAGHLIKEYPRFLLSSNSGNFSPSEDYVIVYEVEGQTVYLLDTKTGDRLFKFSLKGTRRHINSVRIAEKGKLIGITYHNKIELIQFNGVKAWSKEIPNPQNLWLSNDGERLTVRSKNKILRFERIK